MSRSLSDSSNKTQSILLVIDFSLSEWWGKKCKTKNYNNNLNSYDNLWTESTLVLYFMQEIAYFIRTASTCWIALGLWRSVRNVSYKLVGDIWTHYNSNIYNIYRRPPVLHYYSFNIKPIILYFLQYKNKIRFTSQILIF